MNQLLPYLEAKRLEAGCDEVGRGCLAGPVVAAAVILPADFYHPLLNDSKKVPKAARPALAAYIQEKALAWHIAQAEVEEIDKMNILNASFLAMERAVEGLAQAPDFLLIDGNRFRSQLDIPFSCIVKGDGKFQSIAAASILAKVYRDVLMEKLAKEFPAYQWEKNAGYPTKAHRAGILAHGLSPHHRKSFRQLADTLPLPFSP
ncbi:MAG: ribonuclease HII [Nitritalea sp.]